MKYIILVVLVIGLVGCDSMSPKEQYDKIEECKKYNLDYQTVINKLDYSVTSIECYPKEN